MLLAKSAINQTVHEPNEFISNVFLVKKKYASLGP